MSHCISWACAETAVLSDVSSELVGGVAEKLPSMMSRVSRCPKRASQHTHPCNAGTTTPKWSWWCAAGPGTRKSHTLASYRHRLWVLVACLESTALRDNVLACGSTSPTAEKSRRCGTERCSSSHAGSFAHRLLSSWSRDFVPRTQRVLGICRTADNCCPGNFCFVVRGAVQ